MVVAEALMDSRRRAITNRENQTVEITTHYRHRTKNMPAGLLSVLYPIAQLENNIHFIQPRQYLTALWYLVGEK